MTSTSAVLDLAGPPVGPPARRTVAHGQESCSDCGHSHDHDPPDGGGCIHLGEPEGGRPFGLRCGCPVFK